MPKRKVTKRPTGTRELTVPQRHQLRIARDTLNMTDEMAFILGGPSVAEAREIVYRLTGRWPKE